MELPPNPNQDKGFFTSYSDIALGTGKRKAALTDLDNEKAQRLQLHARRTGTPEPAAKAPGGDLINNPSDYRFYPGGDQRRGGSRYHPFGLQFWLGPGPYFAPAPRRPYLDPSKSTTVTEI